MERDLLTIDKLSLAELVRIRICNLLDQLGSHRMPDLYHRVMAEMERVLIEETLVRTKGSRGQAADILGIHRNTLRQRMRALNITYQRGS